MTTVPLQPIRRHDEIRAGYLVLQLEDDGRWREVGEVRRRSGLTARAARVEAVAAAGGDRDVSCYAAVSLSEWRAARDLP